MSERALQGVTELRRIYSNADATDNSLRPLADLLINEASQWRRTFTRMGVAGEQVELTFAALRDYVRRVKRVSAVHELTALFDDTEAPDESVDEIASAMLGHTDDCVAQWRVLNVAEASIEGVVDAAARFRARHRDACNRT